jgi:phospholipid/cholesterol/gamma-HCH transport system substrate-binding protein
MASPARMVGLGVFVIAGLLLFTVGLFMIGDRQMAFAKKFTIYTEFKKITGLQPGAIVRVSGAKAGTIKNIVSPNRPSEKFRVELEITEALHALVRSDSIASIETEGLVGGTFLGIGTGSDTAPAAPRDSTIPGKEPFEIADLMQQMSDTVKKVNGTIDDMRDDVQRAVVAMADTADNANQIIAAVNDDVKAMTSAGARISRDAAAITASIHDGKGTIGKLLNDDELYTHAAAISKQVEEIATTTRQVLDQAKTTLEGFQSKDGPVQGVTASVKQTMDDARAAMVGFAENMDALKHNFLVRGFFNTRGFFNLAEISPAAYRQGALTRGGAKRTVRVWLSSGVLFDHVPDEPATETLTDDGKARLDSAIADFLDRLPGAVTMIEGYAQNGSKDEQYLRARARAAIVRDYLVGRFHLDPQMTGIMPLGSDSTGSPGGAPWDGVALVVFEDRATAKKGK